MIYTRLGSPVTILKAEKEDGTIWVRVRFAPDNREREYAIYELRADDGLSEIDQAIREVSPEINL